jgi:hypothetical protein
MHRAQIPELPNEVLADNKPCGRVILSGIFCLSAIPALWLNGGRTLSGFLSSVTNDERTQSARSKDIPRKAATSFSFSLPSLPLMIIQRGHNGGDNASAPSEKMSWRARGSELRSYFLSPVDLGYYLELRL